MSETNEEAGLRRAELVGYRLGKWLAMRLADESKFDEQMAEAIRNDKLEGMEKMYGDLEHLDLTDEEAVAAFLGKHFPADVKGLNDEQLRVASGMFLGAV
jgi:hypothetical protein